MKKHFREEVRRQLAEIPEEEIFRLSAEVMSRLEDTVEFRLARVVAAYWSFGSEVRTHERIAEWMHTKTVLLPVIDGDTLLLKRFTAPDEMSPCRYGILEPSGAAVDPERVDMLIVPGLAFDRRGNRLGRGKGYYDRLLAGTSAVKVGVCFECQLFDGIPAESHDVRMDAVITENSLILNGPRFRK